jgi:hypothetical protein
MKESSRMINSKNKISKFYKEIKIYIKKKINNWVFLFNFKF